MWAVEYGKGHIATCSVRRTRAQAITAFVDDPAMPKWDYWRAQGCRAVRVSVAMEGV